MNEDECRKQGGTYLEGECRKPLKTLDEYNKRYTEYKPIGINHTLKEIEETVKEKVGGIIDDEIVGVMVYGSRVFGQPDDKSDIDVLIEYWNFGEEENPWREDDLYNYLKQRLIGYKIDGVDVDINPIKKDKSGSIEDYLNEERDGIPRYRHQKMR